MSRQAPPQASSGMPQSRPQVDKKTRKFNLENEINAMKIQKQQLEKEFFKLGKRRGKRKGADLKRKVEVENELKDLEKRLGGKKNELRMMKYETND